MKPHKNTSLKTLKGILYIHGLTYESFALKHGFKLSTVITVTQRYWGRDADPREGSVAREILDAFGSYFPTKSRGVQIQTLKEAS